MRVLVSPTSGRERMAPISTEVSELKERNRGK